MFDLHDILSFVGHLYSFFVKMIVLGYQQRLLHPSLWLKVAQFGLKSLAQFGLK
jgi:hypothetical protein